MDTQDKNYNDTEIRLARIIDHPFIIKAVDEFKIDDYQYIVMEYA
jgi:serine/threonine protein kinase